MSRADHRLDAHGVCRRCALTPAHAEECPPGFWMTELESRAWYELPPSSRHAYERSILGLASMLEPNMHNGAR